MEPPLTKESWNDRRVLVTGHSGFKGSWLIAWLTSLGAEVTGISLPPQHGHDLFHAAGLASKCQSYFGDIRDAELLKLVVKEHRPEVIFHLAAQPLVRESYFRPRETFSTNVMGTLNVLEAGSYSQDLKAILVITTDKVYRNLGNNVPFREDDPLDGHDPYSASKAACEIATQSWARSNLSAPDVKIATARAGNVIGGGDWAKDRLLPDADRAFHKNQPLEIRMPHAVRPWQHVVEPLEGYLRLAQALISRDRQTLPGYNFGPGIEQCAPVQHMVEMARRIWGSPVDITVNQPKEILVEAETLLLDSSAASQDLQWNAMLSLEETIQATIKLYKILTSNADYHHIYDCMIEQIGELRSAGNG
ncbi:MAG: CDP-glucose 4,6-dehydratase [Rhizobiaceae bacterium]